MGNAAFGDLWTHVKRKYCWHMLWLLIYSNVHVYKMGTSAFMCKGWEGHHPITYTDTYFDKMDGFANRIRVHSIWVCDKYTNEYIRMGILKYFKMKKG